MKLENLRDFDWLNEPENVILRAEEMRVAAMPGTDFWQSAHHKVRKDSGHFFYKKVGTHLTAVVHWRLEDAENFNQCGLMVRGDAENWFKISIMSAQKDFPEIGTCLTLNACSDWAGVPLPEAPCEIWYKIVRQGRDYAAFYALDGSNFVRLRQFSLPFDGDVKVGAYICAPQKSSFEAVLEDLDFI